MTNATQVSVEQYDVDAVLTVAINEDDGLTADAVAYELKALAAAAMLALGYHRDLVERYIYLED